MGAFAIAEYGNKKIGIDGLLEKSHCAFTRRANHLAARARLTEISEIHAKGKCCNFAGTP